MFHGQRQVAYKDVAVNAAIILSSVVWFLVPF